MDKVLTTCHVKNRKNKEGSVNVVRKIIPLGDKIDPDEKKEISEHGEITEPWFIGFPGQRGVGDKICTGFIVRIFDFFIEIRHTTFAIEKGPLYDDQITEDQIDDIPWTLRA
jgi:hypothetical protein